MHIYTNRRGNRKVILGPAGRALHAQPAGKNKIGRNCISSVVRKTY